VRHEGAEAALENRAAADLQELLRHACAEPLPLSSRGNNGRYVHIENADLRLLMAD
jgi:hypothetical protein